jgi:hypothetical protein
VHESVDSDPPVAISFEQFGERFLRSAVTAERITAGVASLAGRVIEFGPVNVAPAGLIKVSAQGTVGQPDVAPREATGEPAAFDLALPVDLDLQIDLGLDRARFHADVRVNLRLTARAVAPLAIYIDIENPTRRNVDVDLRAEGMRASVLQVVGRVDGEIRKAVSRYVAREITKPEMQARRLVDVAAALGAYRHG